VTPGHVRLRIVVSDAGTPNDPNDDFELSTELIRG
jgi:hypothetical protein